jgi:hypothetical protein
MATDEARKHRIERDEALPPYEAQPSAWAAKADHFRETGEVTGMTIKASISRKLYLAGPMTGIKAFNFPAFHEAQQILENDGYSVVNPADLDDPAQRRAAESSPDGNLKDYEAITGMTWADFLARDVKLITDEVDAVVLLGGWENSKGAKLEKFIAELTGKPCLDYGIWLTEGGYASGWDIWHFQIPKGEPVPVIDGPENVLGTAQKITAGTRLKEYGSAAENAEAFAELASAATGLDIAAEHYPVLMICVKLARLKGGDEFHRDTWVDIAGYARVAEMIETGQ